MKLKQILQEVLIEQIGFYTIIPFIESKLNIKVGEFIGNGEQSDVFAIGDDKVLKITSNKYDVEGFMVADKYKKYPLPKVYGIYKIDPNIKRKEIRRFERDIWIIISEQVEVGNVSESDCDTLRKWFLENLKLDANDVHRKNVGKKNGVLIYIDPSFEQTSENANNVELLK